MFVNQIRSTLESVLKYKKKGRVYNTIVLYLLVLVQCVYVVPTDKAKAKQATVTITSYFLNKNTPTKRFTNEKMISMRYFDDSSGEVFVDIYRILLKFQ